MKGATPLFVAAKVAVDQTLWAPVFMCMFFTYMCLFDGTPDLILAKIKQDTFTAVKGSWYTWIPAHTINFAFIPPSQRLLYINSIQIFFNMYDLPFLLSLFLFQVYVRHRQQEDRIISSIISPRYVSKEEHRA